MGKTFAAGYALDVEAYLAGEETSEMRHEYVGGEIYAMVGGSDKHNLIAGNLFAALHGHLRGSPCQIFQFDMKVRLYVAGEQMFYYPDVFVSCRVDDRAAYWREQPCLIIEVLSETTARIDRREKLLAYREITTLEDYLLVEQHAIRLTLHRRAADWRAVELGPEDTLRLASVAFEMPVMHIYDGVDLSNTG